MDWPQSPEYKALIELRERKGNVGALTLFQFSQKDKDTEDLFTSGGVIDCIIFGRVKTVPASQLAALTQLLERQPFKESKTASNTITNWPRSSEYDALTTLRQRKGNVGATILCELARKDEGARDAFTSVGVIDSIINGKVKTILKSQLQALTRLLEGLPDKPGTTLQPEAQNGGDERPGGSTEETASASDALRRQAPRRRTPRNASAQPE